jgi:transcriptional regulator with XRE-family HTH domain
MSRHATRHFSGRVLREARLDQSPPLTGEQLARRLDVTYRTVQRWEAGDSSPSGGDLLRLALALSCEPDSFYVEQEPAA